MSDQTCAKCRYVFAKKDQNMACRRYPPQTHFIVVLREAKASVMLRNGPGMIPTEEQRSAYPVVLADWTCGEWAPRIEVMS